MLIHSAGHLLTVLKQSFFIPLIQSFTTDQEVQSQIWGLQIIWSQ